MKKLFILLLPLLLVACSGGKQEAQMVIPESWATHSNDELSVQYPTEWELDASGQMGTQFMIFSPFEENDDFRENVNLVSREGEMTLKELGKMGEKEIKAAFEGVEIISSETFGDYHEMVFKGKSGIYDFHWIQHYYSKNGKIYALTFTAEQEFFKNYEKTARTIMASFKLK